MRTPVDHVKRYPRPYFPGLQRRSGPLAQLIVAGQLRMHFQPITSLGEGGLLGHEALIRGPAQTPFEAPGALLSAAREEGLLIEFETEAMLLAVETWLQTPHGPGSAMRLFVNIGPDTLLNVFAPMDASALRALFTEDEQAQQGRRVVFELTEYDRIHDLDEVTRVIHHMRDAAGVEFALDDFGEGYSSLRLWSQIEPDFVKIDKYFTRQISESPRNLQTLRALTQIAETFGSKLIAEGIETPADMRVLRELGIGYGQGFFLGRPNPQPLHLAEAARSALRENRIAVLPEVRRAASVIKPRPLQVVPAQAVSASTTHNEVINFFLKNPQSAVAVLNDQQAPVGLIHRLSYMSEVAKPYFREIHGKRSCISLADTKPLVLEADTEVDGLLDVLTSDDQKYLSQGFVITRDGRYEGMGTGENLVRSVTEMRIEAARHANPLTFLPGNIPITQHIERLLERGVPFVACYADLNSFKPFNDQYGYWRGDQMIRQLAAVITQHCNPQLDFVGHVGGDDFIMLMQSADWQLRCKKILRAFNVSACQLYDPQAQQRGGIDCEDRQGVMRFFPMTTLTIGAVPAEVAAFASAEEVASMAAKAKHYAKVHGVGFVVKKAAPPAPPKRSLSESQPGRSAKFEQSVWGEITRPMGLATQWGGEEALERRQVQRQRSW